MEHTRSLYESFKSTVNAMSRWAMALGMGWVLVMMFLTTLDVGGRFFFSNPIPGTIESSEFMLAVFGLMGLAYTHGRGANVKVTMLTRRFPGPIAFFLNLITGLLGFQIISMVSWYAIVMAIEEFHNGTTTDRLAIPVYPLYVLLSIGAFLLALEILINIVDALRGLRQTADSPV
jgi:TRAP-type C4-dicarboxylate transport system permease small subunit